MSLQTASFQHWINISANADHRSYLMDNGALVFVPRPEKLRIERDGTHHHLTKDGSALLVQPNWVAFSFKGEWTFNVADTAEEEDWQDVSSLTSLTYKFDEQRVEIDRPVKLFVKRSGSHKIVCDDGVCWYVRGHFSQCLAVPLNGDPGSLEELFEYYAGKRSDRIALDRASVDAVFEEGYQERLYQMEKWANGEPAALNQADDAKIDLPDTWVMWIGRHCSQWNGYLFPKDYSAKTLREFRKQMVKVMMLAVGAILWVDRRLQRLED